jgi:hypothetical protein
MSLAGEVGFGVYVGLLTGVFTGFLAFLLAFAFKYVAGVKLSDRMALLIGLSVAGLQGGLLGLLKEPEQLRSPTVLTALLLVLLFTLYAHKKGTDLAGQLPRGVWSRRLWQRTLSSEAVERIGRFGQVRVRVAGEVDDVEGYPPLPERLRAEIAEGIWPFPADLPLSELEARLADRLRTTHDLAAVRVAIDADGRATVAAAPPAGGLSRRVPGDRRAVSVEATLPAGLARGDSVDVAVGEEWLPADVVSVAPADDEADDGGDEERDTPTSGPRRRAGGEGRATVAVPPTRAAALVDAEARGLVATARGTSPEFELVSLLRRNGARFRKLTVREGGAVDGARLGDLGLRRTHGVDVLAIQRAGEWTFTPDGAATLRAGDDLFVAGSREGLGAVEATLTAAREAATADGGVSAQ